MSIVYNTRQKILGYLSISTTDMKTISELKKRLHQPAHDIEVDTKLFGKIRPFQLHHKNGFRKTDSTKENDRQSAHVVFSFI